MTHQTQADPRDQMREALKAFENSICSLEGVLELITPQTLEEGQRGTLLRESVSWALMPVVDALRRTLDQSWDEWKKGGPEIQPPH